MRACSAETAAACCWSSQKPGAESSPSSWLSRAESESGSKVITDPAELGPDLLELLLQWRGGFHAVLDGTFGRAWGYRADYGRPPKGPSAQKLSQALLLRIRFRSRGSRPRRCSHEPRRPERRARRSVQAQRGSRSSWSFVGTSSQMLGRRRTALRRVSRQAPDWSVVKVPTG